MFKIEEKRNIKMLARRGTNRSIPKLFRNGEKRTVLFQKKRIEEEQREVFQSFSETERNERICSKKFESEEEQTVVIQRFSGTKRNERIYSKKTQIERKRTASIVIMKKKNRKKTNVRLFLERRQSRRASIQKKRGFDIARHTN